MKTGPSDITHEQILNGVNELIGGLIEILTTRDELRAYMNKLEDKFASKDELEHIERKLDQLNHLVESCLKYKVKMINIRQDVEELAHRFENLRVGLAKASEPL